MNHLLRSIGVILASHPKLAALVLRLIGRIERMLR